MASKNFRSIPHDSDLEKAIVASLLTMPSFIGDVSEVLKPADFFGVGLGGIYEQMLERWAEGKPIDLLSLNLPSEAKLEMEVALDMNLAPTQPLVLDYAEMLRGMARKRNLISLAGEIAELGYDETPADDAESESLQLFLNMLEQREIGTYQPLRDLVDEHGDKIVSVLENPQSLIGLDTGLRDLNRVLGGLEPEILIVIAGRPGMGKTSLALTLAMNVARKGHNVGFASLEMSKRHLLERMVARQAGVDSAEMRVGNLPEAQKERVYQALGELQAIPLFFDCQPGQTSVELATRARKLAMTKKAELLIVDYLQLLRDRGDDEIKRLGKMMKMLRVTAQALHIPVIVLHQLSRAVEKRSVKIPMLSDLRDSGHVEQDADQVWFLYREDYYNQEQKYKSESGPCLLLIPKNRMGRRGKITLWFEASGPYFRDMEGVDGW